MSRRRTWLWNLLLTGVEGSAVVWAHSVGVAWSALAVELGGLLLAGAAAVVYVVRVHVPRAARRRQAALTVALARHAALTAIDDRPGSRPGSRQGSRPALPAAPHGVASSLGDAA